MLAAQRIMTAEHAVMQVTRMALRAVSSLIFVDEQRRSWQQRHRISGYGSLTNFKVERRIAGPA